jgi:hypothetical protein
MGGGLRPLHSATLGIEPLLVNWALAWGWGRGDDAADALRYLVATKSRAVVQRKLRGL